MLYLIFMQFLHLFTISHFRPCFSFCIFNILVFSVCIHLWCLYWFDYSLLLWSLALLFLCLLFFPFVSFFVCSCLNNAVFIIFLGVFPVFSFFFFLPNPTYWRNISQIRGTMTLQTVERKSQTL